MSRPSVPCDRCGGSGTVTFYEVGSGRPIDTLPCTSCQGQAHVSVDPMTDNEAFIYVCATRYALNRQTYAGGIVIGELLKALPRIPYNDRKVLEREIADALFRNEVDAIHRADWQAVVDAIRQQEGM